MFENHRCHITRVSKIPQREKEPSTYSKLFAKQKAQQPSPRNDETNEEPRSTLERTEPLGPHMDADSSTVAPKIQAGTSRIPLPISHRNGRLKEVEIE